jgi:pyruvate,water dikinase
MAGQYASFLSIVGVNHIVDSIHRIWDSEESASETYRTLLDLRPKKRGMEVLIQEMVAAVCSGVAFSRNPVKGTDEVIIEAVEGTSEALLQGGVTPHRWAIMDKTPVSDWPVLPTHILEEIVQTTRQVAAGLGYPVDLEWAYDGVSLWWLQVRPITSLRGLPIYSNRISREYLPGFVKPLVWSVNVPMINGAWVDLFESVVGPLSIDPLSLAKQFHYRAYFNMSGMGELFKKLGLPEDTLEQLLGIVPSSGKTPFGFRPKMLRHLPRLLLFLADIALLKLRLARWVKKMRSRFDTEQGRLMEAWTPLELVTWADEFLRWMREAAYFRILTVMLHFAIGQLGRRAIRKGLSGEISDLELDDPRLGTYDPQVGLRRLSDSFFELPSHIRKQAKTLAYWDFFNLAGTEVLHRELEVFLKIFGDISESGNDFSTAPWREDPTAILRFLSARGKDIPAAEKRSSGRILDRKTTRWARRVTRRRVDRERVGAVFLQGFYLLHVWALQLGQVFTERGVLDSAYDVFYLKIDELRTLARGEITDKMAAALVNQRKSEIEEAKKVSLPDMILGDYVKERVKKKLSSNVLSGIPTSRGVYKGPARVIRSMDEFGILRDGDVLVVPFSDVAWTPLFARAGAIVAEAGGMLSHSSIVAREFGKPAVVSVLDACSLLAGTHVRVNGHEGTVTILDGP